MKRSSQFALLLGLILVTWLVVVYHRRPGPAPAGVAISPKSPPRPVNALTDAGIVNEPTPAETTAGESSWATALRELRELASENPDAALARVAAMPDKHERKSAAKAVCAIVAGKDPEKAVTAAWRFDLGKFSDEAGENAALENLAQRWAEKDLGKAFLWASGLPADDEARRDRVVKGIALALAQIAPAEAARLVTEQIGPDSSVRAETTIAVLRQWASQEYAGAVAWASLFPEGALRERGIETLADIDPHAPPTSPPAK